MVENSDGAARSYRIRYSAFLATRTRNCVQRYGRWYTEKRIPMVLVVGINQDSMHSLARMKSIAFFVSKITFYKIDNISENGSSNINT